MTKSVRHQEVIDLFLNERKRAVEIVKITGYSQAHINAILRQNSIPLRKDEKRKYKLNMDFLKNQNSEEYLYFLGLLMSDGSLNETNYSISIDLMRGDQEILKQLSSFIYNDDTYQIKEYLVKAGGFRKSSGIKYRLLINSKDFYENFRRVGVTPRKSFSLKWPSLNIPENKLNHFVRGMIDGDGCLSKFNKSDSYCVHLISSVDFCETMKKEMAKVGFNFKIKYHEFSQKMATLWLFGCQTCEKFLDWLYKDSFIFLKRKHVKYLALKKDVLHKKLKLKRKGYTLHKYSNLYHVVIKKNYKILVSKYFKNEEDAAIFYKQKNEELLASGLI